MKSCHQWALWSWTSLLISPSSSSLVCGEYHCSFTGWCGDQSTWYLGKDLKMVENHIHEGVKTYTQIPLDGALLFTNAPLKGWLIAAEGMLEAEEYCTEL